MIRHLYILVLIFFLKSCQLLETREQQAIDICKNSKIQFSENNLFQYFGLTALGLSQESKWSEFANSIAKDNPNSKYKWDAHEIENTGIFLVSFTDETNWGQNWEVSLDQQIVKHINSNEYLSRKYGLTRLDPDDNFKIGEVKEEILKKEKKYDYSISKNTASIVYSIKGFLVNNTDKNITKADISGSLSLIFDSKVVESKEIWESGFKRKISKSTPWKPQEKIEFFLKTEGIEEIYLQYDPEYVIFTINVSAEDPVGFTFDKAIKEIDLKEEWRKLSESKGRNQNGESASNATENRQEIIKPSTIEGQEKTAEKPKIDQRAIFGAGGTSGKSSTPASGGAQGSSIAKGDEGRPTGTVDGRAIMGEGIGKGTASGAGYNLDMAGWDFASRPTINDNVSKKDGRIVFKMTVDDSGRVVQAVPLEYNVSNDVLAYYRQVVNQINFKKQGGTAADFSSGKITFIIKVD